MEVNKRTLLCARTALGSVYRVSQSRRTPALCATANSLSDAKSIPLRRKSPSSLAVARLTEEVGENNDNSKHFAGHAFREKFFACRQQIWRELASTVFEETNLFKTAKRLERKTSGREDEKKTKKKFFSYINLQIYLHTYSIVLRL